MKFFCIRYFVITYLNCSSYALLFYTHIALVLTIIANRNRLTYFSICENAQEKIPLPVKILLIRVFLTQKALFYYATYLCLLKRHTVSTVFPFSHEIVSTSSPLTTTGKLNVIFLMGCSYLSCSSFGYICISLIKP